MPDIGEGIAEVELVAWHVKPGDTVKEDQVLADVMTDKATVEIPSPVAGKVLALGGKVGRADGGGRGADPPRSGRRGQCEGGCDRSRRERERAGLRPAATRTLRHAPSSRRTPAPGRRSRSGA